MTLLKFAVALLSTMVVAVNLSTEQANSLVFAQQVQSEEELVFRAKVLDLKNDLDWLRPQVKDAERAALTAKSDVEDNKTLKADLEQSKIDPALWEAKGYKVQAELDMKNREATSKARALKKDFIKVEDQIKRMCSGAEKGWCDVLNKL